MPGAGGCSAPARCSGSCSGTSPARSAATGSSTSRACASWSRSTTSRSTSVNEFADGGLHPGYAFPLWHGFLALVAKVAFVDPRRRAARGVRARAARRARRLRGRARALPRASGRPSPVGCAQVALTAFAPGHGGAYTALALPATASRQLLVPAALALALGCGARPVARRCSPRRRPPGSRSRSCTRRTRSSSGSRSPASSSCAGSWCASEARPIAAALAALVAAGSGVPRLARCPSCATTASRSPGRGGAATRAFEQYAGQLDVCSDELTGSRRSVFGRSGRRRGRRRSCSSRSPALALAPALGGLRRSAARSRCCVVDARAVALRAVLRPRLALAVPPRRGLPAVRVRLRRRARRARRGSSARSLLPVALAAGIVLQLAYPGDFGYVLDGRRARRCDLGRASSAAPSRSSSAACSGAARWSGPRPLVGVAAALFVLPVASHAAWQLVAVGRAPPSPLTPGLVQALRDDVPTGDVVFSDLETSYRIAAAAPVYIAAAPPGHVADTEENRPYERREDNIRFFAGGDLAIPRRRRRRLARGRPRPIQARPAARESIATSASRSTASTSRVAAGGSTESSQGRNRGSWRSGDCSIQPALEPLVRARPVRSCRCRHLVRDDRPRSWLDYEAIPESLDRRAGCSDRDPLDRRCVDGEPDGARAHDHHGRRPARDGPVLAADRAARSCRTSRASSRSVCSSRPSCTRSSPLREVTNNGDGTGHVPGIAVLTAFVLVLASIAVLVVYVQHIGQALRVSALIELVGKDTRALLDRVYPDKGAAARRRSQTAAASSERRNRAWSRASASSSWSRRPCAPTASWSSFPRLGEFVPADAPLFRVARGATGSTRIALAGGSDR